MREEEEKIDFPVWIWCSPEWEEAAKTLAAVVRECGVATVVVRIRPSGGDIGCTHHRNGLPTLGGNFASQHITHILVDYDGELTLYKHKTTDEYNYEQIYIKINQNSIPASLWVAKLLALQFSILGKRRKAPLLYEILRFDLRFTFHDFIVFHLRSDAPKRWIQNDEVRLRNPDGFEGKPTEMVRPKQVSAEMAAPKARIRRLTLSSMVRDLLPNQRLAPVHLTCIHPEWAPPGRTVRIEVALHLPENVPQTRDIRDVVERSLGIFRLQNYARVLVRISELPDGFVLVTKSTPLEWIAPCVTTQFAVSIAKTVAEGSYCVGISITTTDGVTLCHVVATLQVSMKEPEKKADKIKKEARIPRRVFASYSSKDRQEVLKRVSTVESLGIDVFVDCLDIKEGQHWESRIKKEVCSREALLLFWSRNAAASKWVRQEWSTALENRGLDYILPNALESVARCPPPQS